MNQGGNSLLDEAPSVCCMHLQSGRHSGREAVSPTLVIHQVDTVALIYSTAEAIESEQWKGPSPPRSRAPAQCYLTIYIMVPIYRGENLRGLQQASATSITPLSCLFWFSFQSYFMNNLSSLLSTITLLASSIYIYRDNKRDSLAHKNSALFLS